LDLNIDVKNTRTSPIPLGTIGAPNDYVEVFATLEIGPYKRLEILPYSFLCTEGWILI
jgi:hypothetical protein